MASLVFFDQPNCITQVLSPGDTAWHQITVPTAVIQNNAPNVTAAFCALGASGAAGTVLVDFDHATAPSVGFPVLSGTTIVIARKNNYWYKTLTSGDSLYILWSF